MNDETINLLIVIGLLVAFIVFSHFRSSRRQLRASNRLVEVLQAQAAAPAELADPDQVARLEERLRVVERIVTDNGFDVATQIEALRREPANEKILENRSASQ